MRISYPFNAMQNGKLIEESIAFNNQNSQDYQQELREGESHSVPREKFGDKGFYDLVETFAPICGVKWAYTVFRELYVVPASYGRLEPTHAYAAGNDPVYCAGFADFDAKSPKVLNVNQWSGHYKPSKASLSYHVRSSWDKTKYVIQLVGMDKG